MAGFFFKTALAVKEAFYQQRLLCDLHLNSVRIY